ncbi:MAG TPA: DUF371 domain-containing protein [Methanomicrobia archaeon]|nr:DUF371 domain-containing protein [Methanomicrobia archaeon]
MDFVITARGHENVRATHRTTIEVTTDSSLTPRGTCIVAVGADRGLCDMPQRFKDELRKNRVRVTFRCGGAEWTLWGRGTPRLELTHPHDMVIRTSAYECPRTLLVDADGAACDMPRELVRCLQDPSRIVTITLTITG